LDSTFIACVCVLCDLIAIPDASRHNPDEPLANDAVPTLNESRAGGVASSAAFSYILTEQEMEKQVVTVLQ
jgi:hypothetical protein